MNQNCSKKILLTTILTGLLVACQAQESQTNTSVDSTESIEMKVETLSEQLFFSTTRIEAASPDGKSSSIGTGFIFAYEDKTRIPFKTHEIPFVVTCKHVLYGYKSASFTFIKANANKPQLGQKEIMTVPDIQQLVFYDPDPSIDVALVSLSLLSKYSSGSDSRPYIYRLPENLIPSAKQAEELSAIQSIVFVGYPNGMRDEKNFLPIARRGYTASPYVVDFNGLPLFLIDAGVFPGSSGSPVMVMDEGSYGTARGFHSGSRAYFLGMVSLAYFQPVEGEIQFKPIPSQFVPVFKEQRFLNIGGVIKAKAILKTMDHYIKSHPNPQATRISP
jgi:hypothetical protein